MGLADYKALINPRGQTSPRMASAVDCLSWMLPVLAAVCSVGGGVEALRNDNTWAAVLGIAGGIVGALGVIFTNWASYIRDRRLAEAWNLGALGVDMATDALDRTPGSF